jgi:CRISPR/Cas system CMR subunit Cmr6 (Cas7 group RAMP superfamily)
LGKPKFPGSTIKGLERHLVKEFIRTIQKLVLASELQKKIIFLQFGNGIYPG